MTLPDILAPTPFWQAVLVWWFFLCVLIYLGLIARYWRIERRHLKRMTDLTAEINTDAEHVRLIRAGMERAEAAMRERWNASMSPVPYPRHDRYN